MAKQYDFAKEAATSIYAVSEEEAVKLACEARERYEHDWAGSYKSGERAGFKKGIEKEKKNTEREKNRADKAEAERDEVKQQLQEAMQEIAKLKESAN